VNLTRHTDYGLRVLMVLAAARERPDPKMSTAEIAGLFDISLHHLHKVVQGLQQGGFVHTSRGRGGGLTLAHPPAEVSVGAVVRALEPNLHVVECFGDGVCALLPGCGLKGVLASAQDAFLSCLDEVSLADITQQNPAVRLLASGAV